MISKRRLAIPVINIIAVLFAMALYVKEFYILASGSLQIGDILLILAFFAVCLYEKRVKIQRIDTPLFVFVFLAILVNFTYYIIYLDSSFLMFSLYLLFSVIVVLLTRSILYSDVVLKYTSLALKAALITQLVIRFLGRGRYFYGRYSGTFNDPNQFGYYILMCVFLIYVIGFLRNSKQQPWWIIIGGFLIILCQSSGMLLGFAVFIALYIWKITGDQKKVLKFATRFAAIILLIFATVMLLTVSDLTTRNLGNWNNGLTRLVGRISSNGSIANVFNSYLQDRCITRVFENPLALLYGAGEGMWTRYPSNNEIHATMISFCFYYGIIPYLFWILWLRNNLKNIHPDLMCVYVALIAEAFTLANHRQPFFWILFVLASSAYAKRDSGKRKALADYSESEST